jgi:mRNA interferase MazF
LKRGDVVITSLPRDHGKPRPAVIVQSDRFLESDGVILCPFTSDPVAPETLRFTLAPTEENGLGVPSQIMVEKLSALPRSKCKKVVGRIDQASLQRLDEALALVIGLAG